ncbi:hypothetical protein QBC44DRAFT_161689 [Cladorrhinum sp. PSN332]|nr:hypothetical protein QBC44DRAFT_161689 [Cladorrhinum sp. PSN332]
MPIIRNPFARRPGTVAPQVQDENNTAGSRPDSVHRREDEDRAHPGFERADTVGSKASSAWSIRSGRKSQDTGEYKMSVVNDSGIYLPPSPTEKQAIWPRRYLSRNPDNNGRRSEQSSRASGEIEHFPISRESFDSYRRSFDISAKRPVIITSDTYNHRQSLDSSRFYSSSRRRNEHQQQQQQQYTPRSSRAAKASVLEDEPEEDVSPGFEDVVLGDDYNKPLETQQQQQQKKKTGGFFSRLGHHSETTGGTGETEKEGGGWSFGMVGRGARHNTHQQQQQQVQVQELGAITRPMTRDGGGGGGGVMKGVEVEA